MSIDEQQQTIDDIVKLGIQTATERNHDMRELTDMEQQILAVGTFAICSHCAAKIRYYNSRLCGEAYNTWCPDVKQVGTNVPSKVAREMKDALYQQYLAANLNEWASIIHEYAKSHGWWDKDYESARNFGDLMALLHSEVSEAYEEYREGKRPNERYYNNNKPVKDDQGNILLKPEGIPSELGDLLIRVFDLCGYYKVDILDVVIEKHYYNTFRPYRHGGKKS